MIAAKRFLLAGLVTIILIAQPLAQAVDNLSVPPALPDLVVTSVSTSDYDTVKARVKNQGDITATPFYMAITIKTSDGKTKVFSPKVNGLAPGQEMEVSSKTGLNLVQADYEAKADRSNSVNEINEENNTLKGNFGGKP